VKFLIALLAAAVVFSPVALATPSIAHAAPPGPVGPNNPGGGGEGTDGSGGTGGDVKPRRADRGAVARSQPVTPFQVGAPRAPAANRFGPRPLFQNRLWWFGTPNPNPPPPAFINTFEPLSSLPGWSLPYYGWYRNLDFEACVLGLSNTITPSVGPYGTSTTRFSSSGCA
jgi:hypothetical protein